MPFVLFITIPKQTESAPSDEKKKKTTHTHTHYTVSAKSFIL